MVTNTCRAVALTTERGWRGVAVSVPNKVGGIRPFTCDVINDEINDAISELINDAINDAINELINDAINEFINDDVNNQ